MNQFLRTTAIMLLVLSRTPAFATPMPVTTSSDAARTTTQNEVSSRRFKHSLSGLYGIKPFSLSLTQPYNDFDVLYSKSHQAQHELETICKSTAMLTNSDALFSGVKSAERAKQKIALELNNQTDKITDLARATIVAHDVGSLVEVYEALGREATIVQVKNRFKTPAPSGYRDLNVLVKLPKTQIIAEVQLHLQAIADVKSGAEHDLYKNIQHIERNAQSQGRQLNDFELAQINQLRSQSLDLYQQAWQPYITTHIQAA